MKGKSLLQPAGQPNQRPNTITIKINKPTLDTFDVNQHSHSNKRNHLRNIIKQEIKQIKARIQHSSKILAESRRQKHSPSKMVSSDYMPIRFNYQSAKTYSNNFDLYRLQERDSEQSSENSSQGTIQLPVHLQSEQRNYMNDYIHKKGKVSARQETSRKEDRGLYLNQFTNSLQRINLNKSLQTLKTTRNLPNPTVQKKLLKTQRLQISYRQKNKSNLNQCFINKSKQKDIVKKEMEENVKVKIKLNNPSKTVRTRNNTQIISYNTRPRYHIEFPQHKEQKKQQQIVIKQSNKSDWQKLKEQLQRYQFVRKYFSESDLYQIYEYLRKNHISQDRWPIFVVDQAFKKMNGKHK